MLIVKNDNEEHKPLPEEKTKQKKLEEVWAFVALIFQQTVLIPRDRAHSLHGCNMYNPNFQKSWDIKENVNNQMQLFTNIFEPK